MIAAFLQQHFGQFSDEELEDLRSMVEIIGLKKNENYISVKAGQRSNKLITVIEGSLYTMYIDSLGNKIIHDVFYPKDKPFVFLPECQQDISIRANEKTTLLIVTKEDMEIISKRHPRFYTLKHLYTEQLLILAYKRIAILREKSPKSAIDTLFNQLPQIFKHFTFSQVASFLGVHRNSITKAIKKH